MKNQYPTFVDIFAIIGVFVGVSLVAGMIVLPLQLAGMAKGPLTAITYALSMGGTLPVILILRKSRTGRHWPISLAFRMSWLPAMGWAMVMIAGAGFVLEPLLALFPKEWYAWLDNAIGKGWWAVLTAGVMAPILEEWLFRGVIQPPAVEKFGAFRGILLSAAIFGLIHFIPMQVINAFVVGIIIGYLFYKTRSLVPVILLHALNNGVSLLIGDTSATLRELIPQDSLYYTIYGVSLALLAIGAIQMVRELNKENGTRNTQNAFDHQN